MATTVFVSPGVYTREQDFSVFASRIGITRLGLIGKTAKGPAMEAITVASSDEFLLRFGATDPSLPMTYVANAFLSQANDLTVVRVLGTGGYDDGGAWLIVADDLTYYYGSGSTATGVTFSADWIPNTSSYTFITSAVSAGQTFVALNTAKAFTVGDNLAYIDYSGTTVSTQDWIDALGETFFSGWGITLGGGSSTTYLDTSGVFDSYTLTVNTLHTMGQYSGATLAVLRSKKDASGTAYYNETTDIQISATTAGSPLSDFVIFGSTGPLTATTNGYTVSLDETKDNYLVKVFGQNPKVITDTPNLYVEKIYPHFVREATTRNDIEGVLPTIVYRDSAAWSSFTDDYTHSQTPWIVSRVVGSDVNNLFKFHTISDGDASAREIKISIANIDPINYTFDVIVRDFYDTDASASQTALERFSNLTLDSTAENFIGKRIGTYDEEYPSKSLFVTVELAESYPANSVPAGFRGYTLRSESSSGTCANIYYKRTYLSADTVFKTYLGISELGYTSYTSSYVGVRNSIKSIESDLFVYEGTVDTSTSTIKGFHMESTAPTADFVVGEYATLTAYTKTGYSTITDKNKLKFTVVPAGGFDGFNKYSTFDDPYQEFVDSQANNVLAYKDAVDVLANPEETDINLLATPGIDFSNNTTLVRYALDMIEERADTLYIIDAPRITDATDKGTPEEVVNLLEATGIDSNYAATYWPWIQIEDTSSGKYTYQPPTLMAIRAAAYTDNVSAPWFAMAGLNRGTAPAYVKKVDVKLTSYDRDTLYSSRVNPIASFVQQGIVIWGNKTLQVKESALDRINIRRLLLQVRRLIAAASLTLLFEQNDQTLRDQFLAKVEPILLQIQNQRGLTAFKVVMDDSNNTEDTIDRNMLIGKIQLKPTRTAEFIDLTFSVLPTGANFEDF